VDRRLGVSSVGDARTTPAQGKTAARASAPGRMAFNEVRFKLDSICLIAPIGAMLRKDARASDIIRDVSRVVFQVPTISRKKWQRHYPRRDQGLSDQFAGVSYRGFRNLLAGQHAGNFGDAFVAVERMNGYLHAAFIRFAFFNSEVGSGRGGNLR